MRVSPILIALAIATAGSTANGAELLVATGGGIIAHAEREALFSPAEKELGIKIKETTIDGLQDVRVQVQSNSVTWDISQMSLEECMMASKEGLLEKIDTSIVSTEGFDKNVVTEYCIPAYYYSTVIASASNLKQAKSWADFFDAENFPGDRSIYNSPRYNLEAALLADGVPADKLYPLDLDRAFRKLEALKPHITVWWQSGAQSAQLLKDGEVDYIGMWNGRAAAAIKDGAKATFTFNQAILSADCFVILKGAPNKELAQKALAIFFAPGPQAHLPLYVDYGPANAKAFSVAGVLSDADKARVNTSPENKKTQVVQSEAWWGEHGQEAVERWENFRQR
ncbi:ABC transporter substrate-binding protein [Microvirga pakistanensis]|uniref:ABC transporter substrate-binding protein n=1 Tax=Microvirga pakistanensis TaxID=1682650 RepID=UPI00106A4CBF|nr:ABC transporter substrate-binding protein [Microvirga pakistanensis]